jgi:hypothetical protein
MRENERTSVKRGRRKRNEPEKLRKQQQAEKIQLQKWKKKKQRMKLRLAGERTGRLPSSFRRRRSRRAI